MRSDGVPAQRLSHGNLGDLTWSFAQMLRIHTSTGCPTHPGDLIGSGTISGPEEDARGCMLELTWRGTNPASRTCRTEPSEKFRFDGDELTIVPPGAPARARPGSVSVRARVRSSPRG